MINQTTMAHDYVEPLQVWPHGSDNTNFNDAKVAHLRLREQELEAQTAEDIMSEFGI